MRYRVDNVPWPWRPIWLAASWLIAAGFFLLLLLLNVTCRIRIKGADRLDPQAPYIYSFWHRSLGVWFAASLRSQRGYVWLQHPAAYMKPVQIVLKWMGASFILGSSGEEGRAAARSLADLLRSGASTAIAPDGPGGPPCVLKKGVLHIALDSGVAIVPVRMNAKPALRLPTWDRKVVPLPFGRIDLTFAKPIRVTGDLENAGRMVADAMSGEA